MCHDFCVVYPGSCKSDVIDSHLGFYGRRHSGVIDLCVVFPGGNNSDVIDFHIGFHGRSQTDVINCCLIFNATLTRMD